MHSDPVMWCANAPSAHDTALRDGPNAQAANDSCRRRLPKDQTDLAKC